MPDLDTLSWASDLLALDVLTSGELDHAPRWATPSVVGNHNAHAIAASILFIARRDPNAPSIDDDLAVETVRLSLTLGHNAAKSATSRVAAHCGLPLLAGHVAARAQFELADDLLRPVVGKLVFQLWPVPAAATGPGGKAVSAALALVRHVRTYSPPRAICLEDLARLGRADSTTYAPSLRQFLARTLQAARTDYELVDALREALRRIVAQHDARRSDTTAEAETGHSDQG